jgi:integrase
VRDYATHQAVHQRVSASTQNQALSAVLFLCREVLGVEVEGVALATRAKRGIHLPVVLSMPETAALLGAMRGTSWLMAALIYGGGLRVSECCGLRIKDVDFDQGLIFVRGSKGAKDRSTLLAELGRDELRAHLQRAEARYRADRTSGLAGVSLPEALERKYPRLSRTRMVLGLSQPHLVDRPSRRHRASTSRQRLGDSESRQGGGRAREHPQTNFRSHASSSCRQPDYAEHAFDGRCPLGARSRVVSCEVGIIGVSSPAPVLARRERGHARLVFEGPGRRATHARVAGRIAP